MEKSCPLNPYGCCDKFCFYYIDNICKLNLPLSYNNIIYIEE